MVEWTSLGEGHMPISFRITVSPGQSNLAISLLLNQGGIPIPEMSPFSLTLLIALLSIIGSIWFRRHQGRIDEGAFKKTAT